MPDSEVGLKEMEEKQLAVSGLLGSVLVYKNQLKMEKEKLKAERAKMEKEKEQAEKAQGVKKQCVK